MLIQAHVVTTSIYESRKMIALLKKVLSSYSLAKFSTRSQQQAHLVTRRMITRIGEAKIVTMTEPMLRTESEYSYPASSKWIFIASFYYTGNVSIIGSLGSKNYRFEIFKINLKNLSQCATVKTSISMMCTIICKLLKASRKRFRASLEKALTLHCILIMTATVVTATPIIMTSPAVSEISKSISLRACLGKEWVTFYLGGIMLPTLSLNKRWSLNVISRLSPTFVPAETHSGRSN